VFLGEGLPVAGHPVRRYTTSHLEDAPGWIPVFRSLRSAVYLRANARNQENRRRVAEWFAGQRVAFDPARGFRAADALRQRPDWAIEHGVVPADFLVDAEGRLERVRYGRHFTDSLSVDAALAWLASQPGTTRSPTGS